MLAAGPPAERALDLGSGGGLPGLVLALAWPHSSWSLLDGRHRSGAFLFYAVHVLGLEGRVTVTVGRAEEEGRREKERSVYDVVVARGFGPPAATAECASPFLRTGGRLVVSEPPGSTGQRWPAEPLEELGLRLVDVASPEPVAVGGAGELTGTFALLEQVSPCPATYPRRVGVPARRLLFGLNPESDVSRETRPGS